MAIYGTKHRIILVNYLNMKAIKLLEILNDQSPINSKEIIENILQDDIMSVSSFYRYINFLVENKIIDKSKNRKKVGGFIYEINKNGRFIYQLIINSNLKFYNKLIPN